ncbi:MAG TPA: hypothetical protein VGD65_03300 [Chryseosolibacter sp.]
MLLITAFGCSPKIPGVYSSVEGDVHTILHLKQDSSYSYVVAMHGRPVIGCEGNWRCEDGVIKIQNYGPRKPTPSQPAIAGVESEKVDTLDSQKKAFYAFEVGEDTTLLVGAKVFLNNKFDGVLTQVPYVVPAETVFLKLFFLSHEIPCDFDERSESNFYRFFIHLNLGTNYSTLGSPPFGELTFRKSRLYGNDIELRIVPDARN